MYHLIIGLSQLNTVRLDDGAEEEEVEIDVVYEFPADVAQNLKKKPVNTVKAIGTSVGLERFQSIAAASIGCRVEDLRIGAKISTDAAKVVISTIVTKQDLERIQTRYFASLRVETKKRVVFESGKKANATPPKDVSVLIFDLRSEEDVKVCLFDLVCVQT